MAAPVADDVLPVTILGRKAVAAIPAALPVGKAVVAVVGPRRRAVPALAPVGAITVPIAVPFALTLHTIGNAVPVPVPVTASLAEREAGSRQCECHCNAD